MSSLTATFNSCHDLEVGQTGAGRVTLHPDVHKALSTFHQWSVALAAPVSYSIIAVSRIKTGDAAPMKVLDVNSKCSSEGAKSKLKCGTGKR